MERNTRGGSLCNYLGRTVVHETTGEERRRRWSTFRRIWIRGEYAASEKMIQITHGCETIRRRHLQHPSHCHERNRRPRLLERPGQVLQSVSSCGTKALHHQRRHGRKSHLKGGISVCHRHLRRNGSGAWRWRRVEEGSMNRGQRRGVEKMAA